MQYRKGQSFSSICMIPKKETTSKGSFWMIDWRWFPSARHWSIKTNLGQQPNVKFFRVYTYLWGTFNLGFAKMTKFDTFGHISPCRWGRRGKKLIKPEYILGQGPTKKKNWSIWRPVCSEINFFTQNIGMFDWLDTWTYGSLERLPYKYKTGIECCVLYR